jgi:stearoyl-CoA desaturase (delta-9 desaturase)
MAVLSTALSWLDSDNARIEVVPAAENRRPSTEVDRWIPFVFLHAGCLAAFFTGYSAVALWTCFALYCVRMFAVTAFYHRYFSHRTFKTSRVAQFVFAAIGSMSVQRGPLWWAAHHRQHHAASDTEDDVHSPIARSFMWSHIGWITSSQNMPTDYSKVRDFAKYPELRFINRFDWLMPTLLFISLYATGDYLRRFQPALHCSGEQLVVWGFFISTALLFHATSSINSVAHLFGYKRFETNDGSLNNPLLALVTFGEGWHNNHHKFSHCTRQGFYWWEIDLSYYGLLLLNFLGIVSDLKPVPSFSKHDSNEKLSPVAQIVEVTRR